MKPTVDIIEDFVNGFIPRSDINSITDNEDGTFTLEVDELLNVRKGSTIEIDNTNYTVTAISADDKTITVSSEDEITGTEYFAVIPFYFHGTPIATGKVLSTIKDTALKTPMVYCMEVMRDRIYHDPNTLLDRESNVRLFFLDEANYRDWDTDEHYSESIVPMANYARAFMAYLRKHKGIDESKFETSEFVYHAKFGIRLSSNGHDANLFPDKLSGVEVEVLLPIKKSFICDEEITIQTSNAIVINSDESYSAQVKPGRTHELPDIQITDSNGDIIQYPSVKDFVCTPAVTENATVENSDQSFSEEIAPGDTLVLEDTTFNIYVNGVLEDSGTLPSMVDNTINIILD